MTFKLAMVSAYPEKPGVVTGGVEGVAYCLSHALLKVAEIDLHILVPCGQRAPGIENRDGITIHWLPVPWLPGFISYWNIYRQTIHRCLAEIKPDITHFQGVAGWSLGYDKPYVLTIHGIAEKDVLFTNQAFRWLRHQVVGLVERMARRNSHDTIAINPYVLDELGGDIRGRRWQIENPVMPEFFEITRVHTPPRILFAGHISKLKNVDGLIRAFAKVQVKIPNVTLQLAGPWSFPEFQAQCVRVVSELGLTHAVQFLGNLDRVALRAELARASCLALVSHQENAPMVVAEAMAAGVPVVASRLCGLPYMIEEGRTGFLVNPEDEDEIAAKLIEVLRDDEINFEMGARCRVAARGRFHAETVARKTLEVYKFVLDRVKTASTDFKYV